MPVTRPAWSRVATTEFRTLWRDGRYRLGAGVVCLAAVAALLAGAREVRLDQENRRAASAAVLEGWRTQADRNPHDAAHSGMLAFKPLSPLAYADRGIDYVAGVAVPMQAHAPGEPEFAPAQDASPLNRFGDLLAARVLQYLLPLLVIAFAFSTIATEREQGTLPMVLSSGISPRALVAGKTLGLGAAFAALLLPVVAVTAVTWLQSGDVTRDLAWRLALLVGLYGCYLVIFLCVAVGVSARAASARQALLVLLVFWAVSTMVAPALGATAASALGTPTSRALMQQATRRDLRDGINGHDPMDQRAKAFTDSVLAAYRVTEVKQLPVNIDGLLMQADEEYAAVVYGRAYEAMHAAWETQGRQQMIAAVVSPTLPVARLSATLSGTDLLHFRDFLDAAERYRRRLMRDLNLDMAANSRSGDWEYKATRSLWSRTGSTFEFVPRSVWSALGTQGLPGMVVLLWLGGAGAFLARSVRFVNRRA